jgi:hypothetical protein
MFIISLLSILLCLKIFTLNLCENATKKGVTTGAGFKDSGTRIKANEHLSFLDP